jgi:tRNA-dihydrouridine synthase A
MREPALVAECAAAMRATVSIPVTIKCRLGVDEQEDYASLLDFVDAVAASGVTLFAVHARKAWLSGLSPKENREVPPLRYEQVYRLKQERPQLDVVINGGIEDVDAVHEHLQHVDGVMIGRAAYHTPWLLHRLEQALFTPTQPLSTRADALRRLRPYVEAQLLSGVALKHMIRHVLGLFHGEPGGRAFRQVLSTGSHRAGADWSLVEAALARVESSAQEQAA